MDEVAAPWVTILASSRFFSISKGSNSNLDCPMVDNEDSASTVSDGGFCRYGISGVGRRSSVSLEGVDGGSLVAEDDVPSPKCNRCGPVCSCEENMEDGCSHSVLFWVCASNNKDNGVASTSGFTAMQEESLGVHDDCRFSSQSIPIPPSRCLGKCFF